MFEAADLGVRICLGALALGLGALRAGLCVRAAARRSLPRIRAGWSALALIWLKPWLDRSILFVLSRAAFGEETRFVDLWRARRAVFWRRIARRADHRRLSPWRSYVQPVLQLEGLRGKARRHRVRPHPRLASRRRPCAMQRRVRDDRDGADARRGDAGRLVRCRPDDRDTSRCSRWPRAPACWMTRDRQLGSAFAAAVLVLEPFFVARRFRDVLQPARRARGLGHRAGVPACIRALSPAARGMRPSPRARALVASSPARPKPGARRSHRVTATPRAPLEVAARRSGGIGGARRSRSRRRSQAAHLAPARRRPTPMIRRATRDGRCWPAWRAGSPRAAVTSSGCSARSRSRSSSSRHDAGCAVHGRRSMPRRGACRATSESSTSGPRACLRTSVPRCASSGSRASGAPRSPSSTAAHCRAWCHVVRVSRSAMRARKASASPRAAALAPRERAVRRAARPGVAAGGLWRRSTRQRGRPEACAASSIGCSGRRRRGRTAHERPAPGRLLGELAATFVVALGVWTARDIEWGEVRCRSPRAARQPRTPVRRPAAGAKARRRSSRCAPRALATNGATLVLGSSRRWDIYPGPVRTRSSAGWTPAAVSSCCRAHGRLTAMRRPGYRSQRAVRSVATVRHRSASVGGPTRTRTVRRLDRRLAPTLKEFRDRKVIDGAFGSPRAYPTGPASRRSTPPLRRGPSRTSEGRVATRASAR